MSAYKHRIITRITLLFLMCSLGLVSAQDTESGRVEKIYTQTDRSFYFPGETLWFKSYLVESNNVVSNLSDIMYAELISPKGSLVKSLKLEVKQGFAYGDFKIEQNWVGGIYKLKMYTHWMHNQGEQAFFTKNITVQKIVKPNLLMTLNFEDKGYGKGAKVTANVEVKDLKYQPLKQVDLNYVVTVKGETFYTKTKKTNAAGEAVLTFDLPEVLSSRDVVLNVLVPHQGTQESISRSVPVVLDVLDLQFFPEGGKMIQDIEGRVAFKAIDEFGKPVDVSGRIIDELGQEITTFRSFHEGIGAFNVKPLGGKTYFALLSTPFASEQPIPLPQSHAQGVSLRVESTNSNLWVRITSTDKRPLVFELISGGVVRKTVPISDVETNINLEPKFFPTGIVQCLVRDTEGRPIAERLVFMNPHRQLKIAMEMEKDLYQIREKVTLKVRTTDVNDVPVPSNLSLSVVDNKLVSFADDKQDHMRSYLLMSSELQGKIHRPKFYFDPKEEKAIEALDYVMLTHGWRDYIQKPPHWHNAQYAPERLTIQTGRVVDAKGMPVKAHLLLLDRYGNKVLVFQSKEDGSFAFKYGVQRHLTLIAYTDDGRSLTILEASQMGSSQEKGQRTNGGKLESKKVLEVPAKFNKPTTRVLKEEAKVSVSLEEDSALLEEVVVTAQGIVTQKNSAGSSVYVRSNEIEEVADVARVLNGVASGVQITRNAGDYGSGTEIKIRGYSSISGNSDPLIIVDGVPYDQESLSNLSSSNISSVHILKNTSATVLYGSNAANGVVVITTKHQDFARKWHQKRWMGKRYKNYVFKHFSDSKSHRFDVGRMFYVPKYSSTEVEGERHDFRQTIYWNPVVQTDANGEATIEYYNSDAITSFQIEAEGIGYNGLIGRKTHVYATKKLLSIDVKIPNYMVLNDTVILPVSLRNASKVPLQVSLDMALPKHLKLLGDFEAAIAVKADSTVVVPVKVMPVEVATDEALRIKAYSEHYKDEMEAKIQILSPYFPTEVSFSGMKTQSYTMPVRHAVPGSLNAQFSLYTNIIGDLMDGVEGMIREPYGCFEQVSSSTYPNILVLKYLREQQKSNPEIEAKALSFIKKGYKKLVSYETSQGGFEWFGDTPPHETLTAYGILEFTEMKEVYKGVSSKMIDRTVKWLLERRDGNGGFKRSNKGYDSFASAPDNVANAYIVYAISESGVEADIEKEYHAAYQEALKSKDAYRMALMACASQNLGKTNHAKNLLLKLKEHVEEFQFKGLPVSATITRSYGNSKQIETVAFTLLALLKDGEKHAYTISEGIEYLLGQRKNGRFGSTQATAMSLKALIEYTKYQNTKLSVDSGDVIVKINGKEWRQPIKESSFGKIVITGMEDYLGEGTQNVEVAFSNSDITFPYAMQLTYDSYLPASSPASPLDLKTVIKNATYNVGANVSLQIEVTNNKSEALGMVTAIVGVPSGTTPQPWQLKELLEQHQMAYYEVFDNYLVFYWRSFQPEEIKSLRLDLKAEVSGSYQAPASTVYLYYGDEFKHWEPGVKVDIK